MAASSVQKFVLLGLIATAWLSGGATGCRFFGNYRESQPNPDPYSGYYEMAVQNTANFYAVHATRGTLSQVVSATAVPSDPATRPLSNPVVFVVDVPTGNGVLANVNNTRLQLPVDWDSKTGNLGFIAAYSNSVPGSPYPSGIAWDGSLCEYRTWLDVSGKVNQNAGPFFTGFSEPLLGRVELKLESNTRFDGECADFLLLLQACYQDALKCGGTSSALNANYQTETRRIFDPYIQSGLIGIGDLDRTTSVKYEVFYR